MRKCRDRYLRPWLDARAGAVTLLDIGAADVNGSYRGLFADPRIRYRGVDLAPGPGVDLVAASPDAIPAPDASADVVISGQALEHCERFWVLFQEMARVLKPDGLLFLIAPSSGPVHRYPVDCYRFYPDAYAALARMSGCHLVDCWLDERGPWKDLVGVFAKQPLPRWSGETTGGEAASAGDPVEVARHDDPRAEAVAGSLDYLAFLKRLHDELAPRLYVEIGVRRGRSLALAQGPAIGVDPAPELKHALGAATTVYRRTADDFFELDAPAAIRGTIDLALIDGMHLFEYALRDFMNLERRCGAGSLIVVDDIFPNHPVQARRDRASRVWTGDVWKLAAILRQHRPDLTLLPVNTSPAGSLLVAGLDPGNRRLEQAYNTAVREQLDDAPADPPAAVLQRAGAVEPDDPAVAALLRALRDARG